MAHEYNNTTDRECDEGYTMQSEFSIQGTCTVPIAAYQGLKYWVVSLAGLMLLLEVVAYIIRRKVIHDKGPIIITLVISIIIQNVMMALRPGLALILGVVPSNSLLLAYVTHISGAFAASIVVLFIFIELRIMHNASMSKHPKKLGFLYDHIKSILLTLTAVQFTLFLVGPLVWYYAGVLLRVMFWVPVVLIDFTVIPYFCYLGILIYRMVDTMHTDKFKKISKQILWTVVVCSIIGIFTGSVGIYSLVDSQFEWVLVELCWTSDIIFNGIIFLVMIRKRSKKQSIRLDPPTPVSAESLSH